MIVGGGIRGGILIMAWQMKMALDLIHVAMWGWQYEAMWHSEDSWHSEGRVPRHVAFGGQAES